MKIAAYATLNNYNTKKKSHNNTNQSNMFLQTRKNNTDSITFGIYGAQTFSDSNNGFSRSGSVSGSESDNVRLDRELREIEKETESFENRIQSKKNEITNEEIKHAEDIKKKNNTISTQQSHNTSLTLQISDQNRTLMGQNTNIQELDSKIEDSNQKINNTKNENDKLKKHKENLSNEIQDNNKIAEQQCQKEIELATVKNNELFNKEVENILSNPKNTLIETVLIPTKLESEGKKAVIPSGILIESESSENSKKMLEWIAKKTNSNYSIIDTESFKSNKRLFKRIVNVAERSKNKFEKQNKRTFTFIENFENIAVPNDKNRQIIGALKNFLDTCSTDYHNTMVVSVKNPSKLEPTVSADHRFQVKIKLDKAFLQKNEFGYISILNEVKEAKSTGKKLKTSSFAFIFNNLIKRIFSK